MCTRLTAMPPTLPCNLKPFLTQVNSTSNCNYDYEMLYFDQMIEYTRQNICPETAKSEVGSSHQSIRIVCLIFCWFYIKLAILTFIATVAVIRMEPAKSISSDVACRHLKYRLTFYFHPHILCNDPFLFDRNIVICSSVA